MTREKTRWTNQQRAIPGVHIYMYMHGEPCRHTHTPHMHSPYGGSYVYVHVHVHVYIQGMEHALSSRGVSTSLKAGNVFGEAPVSHIPTRCLSARYDGHGSKQYHSHDSPRGQPPCSPPPTATTNSKWHKSGEARRRPSSFQIISPAVRPVTAHRSRCVTA